MSEAVIRRSVEAGICPICGRGPFKVVSVHTNKAHGVDKVALRQMAGMTGNEPTCLPEFSERARELGKGRAERMRELAAGHKGKTWDERGGWKWSPAGRARVGQNLKEWEAKDPAAALEARRAAGKKGGRARAEKFRAAREAAAGRSRSGGDAMTEFVIDVPKQRILTSNRRHHWRAKAEAVRLIRVHAAAIWDSRRRKGAQPLDSAHCTAWLTFPDRRRRDANNYEPTIKPLIDGLVSGPPKATGWVGLLPDDSSDYLLGPDMRIDPEVDPNLRALGLGVRVRLVFTERDDK